VEKSGPDSLNSPSAGRAHPGLLKTPPDRQFLTGTTP
jgi:hypothetical protein